MLVFGHVQAKDLALKYSSNIYHGKNTINLRANLAANTGDNNKKKEEHHRSMNGINEEIDRCKKIISDED